jgi:tetratricopeptide (TPR) repeat protein
MAHDVSILPSPTPEHRRVAAGQFERANQVIATGDFDYGIRLLLSCCKLDPANLIYRQALRRTQKRKYNNNMRGSLFAWLLTMPARARITKALVGHDYLAVLDLGERVLTRNPWDIGAQMAMAEAAEVLGLIDMAVWNLEQARQKSPRDLKLNRTLARLYERRGNFTQAIALWEMVRQANPADVEASSKAKDLAASDTIARGQYEAAVGGLSGRYRKTEATPPKSAADAGNRPPSDPSVSPAPSRPVPVRSPAPSPTPSSEETSPGDRRVAREAAVLQARIDSDPTSSNAHLQLAALYRRAGQIDQARAVLFKALDPTANDFEVSAELADLEIEPFRQNLTVTEERLAATPDEELRRIRVRLLKEINTREMDLYRQRADRYPTDMTNRFELGVRLLRAGQVDEAIRELQAARSDPRQMWRCLLYLGHAFKSRNNWKLARRNFEDALQNLPASEDQPRKEIFYQLAQGCADVGDLAEAIHFGNELANLDFGYRDIGHLLDEWQSRQETGGRKTP